MLRLLGTAVLCAALAACTSPTSGRAVKDPKVTVTTTSPRVDTPRDLANVDGCALLTAADLKGRFTEPPAPVSGRRSCRFRNGELGVSLDIKDESYENAKKRVPGGSEQVIDGHSAWWRSDVTTDNPDRRVTACGMVVAVAEDQVLVLVTELYPGDVVRVGSMCREYVRTVLGRLPK